MGLYRHVEVLAGEIGPRPSASREEAAAAAYVRACLEAEGLQVKEDRFRSVATFSWTQLFIYGISLLAFGLAWVSPWAGAALGFVAVAVFIGDIETRFPFVSRLLATKQSCNVVARVAPRGQVGGLVVVCAHIDSSRSSAAFAPAQVGFFRATFLGATASILLLPLLALLSTFWLSAKFLGLPLALYLLVAAMLLIQREMAFRVVPGANDNASGVAVLLGLGEELAHKPLEHLEVWLLATGSEEAGLTGMFHFWQTNSAKLGGALVLNLDNLGRGRLCYTTAEGMLKLRPASARLVRAAQEASLELGIEAVGMAYPTMSTDAQIPLARGGEAMSLMALDSRGIPPDWHWETDVPSRVEEVNLLDACRWAGKILSKLDEQTTVFNSNQ